MSCTYNVNGYVDIRIKLKDKEVSASQSSSSADIASLVLMQIECSSWACEIIDHKMMIESIG